MGYGLPAAIGAVLARPGRLGVALAGDGGFAMTMAELETAVRERAHVIAIVFDNGRYGTIWRNQTQRGGVGGLATKLGAVDFAAIAQACGALGLAVNSDDEFEPALRRALGAGRPALLHLALDPRWTTPDEVPSADEAIEEVETQLGAALDGLAVATEQPAVVKETAEAVDAEADAELAVEDVVEETAEAVDAEADADVSAESQTSSAE
jgi:TPP-dependent trihydroxycyclohexane-1,2-dione (THcHDO) dehydratase